MSTGTELFFLPTALVIVGCFVQAVQKQHIRVAVVRAVWMVIQFLSSAAVVVVAVEYHWTPAGAERVRSRLAQRTFTRAALPSDFGHL